MTGICSAAGHPGFRQSSSLGRQHRVVFAVWAALIIIFQVFLVYYMVVYERAVLQVRAWSPLHHLRYQQGGREPTPELRKHRAGAVCELHHQHWVHAVSIFSITIDNRIFYCGTLTGDATKKQQILPT